MIYYRLIFILCFFRISSLFSQSAQNFFGGLGKDVIIQVVPAADGNFYALGSRRIGNSGEAWLIKLDITGQFLWEKTYSASTGSAYLHGITFLPNGNMMLTGEERTDVQGDGRGLAIMVNSNGNLIWKKTYSAATALFDAALNGDGFLMVGTGDIAGSAISGVVLSTNNTGLYQWDSTIQVHTQTIVKRIFQTTDGDYVIIGRSNVIGVGFEGVFLQKINPNGTLVWQQTADTQFRQEQSFQNENAFYPQPLGAVQATDGTFYITNPQGGFPSDISLLRFSDNGMLLEQKTYGNYIIDEFPYSLTALSDGGWLITGASRSSSLPQPQGFATRIDANGLEKWRQYYGGNDSVDRLFSGVALQNGGFILGGSSTLTGNGSLDGWLLRPGADGNILPFKVAGRVVLDENGNCQADPGEPPLANWFIEATNTSTQVLLTDTEGKFTWHCNPSTTQFHLIPAEPESAWAVCNNDQTIVSDVNHPLFEPVFLVQTTDGGCPHTEVSITQPDLLRCKSSRYYVSVKNRGSGTSADLLLHVALDPALELESASEPFISTSAHSYDFEVPPMEGFEEKIFSLQVRLSCNVQLGASHAVVASISPVECAPSWVGPRFAVQGICMGEEAIFYLGNEGGDPDADTRYRVLEDGLIAVDFTDVTLPSGGPSQTLSFPADGRTWRVELEQADGFPVESYPSATLEGCGVGENGLYSIAFKNAWRPDDAAPEVAVSMAPNSTGVSNKIAESPNGFGYNNLIADSNALEFTARIRNPQAIQASTVEFHLSLSNNLDPGSFEVLSSNSSASLHVENDGQIRVRLAGLQLDTGNQAGSYAFLRFRIRPVAGMPADNSQSLFVVKGAAYLNGFGPYALEDGFLNYSKSFPNVTDEYNTYPTSIYLFGGRGYDFPSVMARTQDGSVFLAGESSSYSNRAHNDGLLIKTDSSGRAYWLNAIDLGDEGDNTFRGVVPLPDGGCLVAGNHAPPAPPGNTVVTAGYIARLDASGHLLWYKKIQPAGSQYNVWLSGMIPTQAGGAVAYGYTANGVNASDHFYMKFDSTGQTLWEQYNYINGSAFRIKRGVEFPDGSLAFMGDNESSIVNADVYVEKTDTEGNLLWSAEYNSENGIQLYSGGLNITADDGLLVSGYSQWLTPNNDYVSTPTYIRFSPAGDFQWEKNPIVGPFKSARIHNTINAPGGGFFSLGEIFMDTVNYLNNAMLLKIDEDGDPLWSKNYGSKNYEQIATALVTGPDQILLWGYNQPRPPESNLQGMLIRTDMEGNLPPTLQREPVSEVARLFPNPAGIQTQMLLPDRVFLPLKWQLYNLSGQIVRSGEETTLAFPVSVQDLPNGMYVFCFPGSGIRPQRLVVAH